MSKKPLVLLVALLLVACSSAKEAAPVDQVQTRSRALGGLADDKSVNMAAPAPPPAKDLEPQEEATTEGAPGAGEAPKAKPEAPEKQAKQDASQGLYIIRTGRLTLQVNSVKAAQDRIGGLVKAAGGFISDSRLDASEGGVPTATLTVRVPAPQFDKLLGALGDVGSVRTRQVSGEDVTLEYVDTTSRIRNLQKEEGQLLELLKRTGKLSDVLEVERELSRVRGEIERAQGRIRHLANQVQLATIEITLTEQVQVATTSPWNLGATLENAFRNAQRELAGTLAWLLATGVTLLVAVLPLFLLGLAAFLLLGWILRRVLVDSMKALPATFFNRLWLGIGFVCLAFAWPPLFAVLGGGLLVVLVLWAGGTIFGKLFRRRGSALDS
jgi:hypothetical protein